MFLTNINLLTSKHTVPGTEQNKLGIQKIHHFSQFSSSVAYVLVFMSAFVRFQLFDSVTQV